MTISAKTYISKSGKQLLIRQIIDGDVEQIRTTFGQEQTNIGDMFLENVIEHPEYGQQVIVAILQATVVAKIRIAYVPYDVPEHLTGKTAFLKDLVVVPELRGDGIGAALIDFAENLIRLEGKTHSGVRITSDNIRPLKLCLRKGYREMFMDLPDAFDLYKDVSEPDSPLTKDELLTLTQHLLERARHFCDRQGMSASFPWVPSNSESRS